MNSVVCPVLEPDCLELLLPLAGSLLPAGFPSPAEDFAQERLNLNALLIEHPACTFIMRVRGHSMINANIHDNDLVVVNRVLRPLHGDIVVAALDQDFTLKTLYKRNGVTKLKAENPAYPDIIPKPDQTLEIWGVVTSSITIHKNIGGRRVRAS